MAKITAPESATPETPASGYVRAYPKSDGKWYGLDDAGTETVLNTDAATVDAAGAVMETDYNAATMMLATDDDTPVASTATQVRTFLSVEENADVTDTENVTAAGALMDSEVDADLKTFSLPASTTISAFGATLVDDDTAATARGTLGLDTDDDVEFGSVSGQAADFGRIDGVLADLVARGPAYQIDGINDYIGTGVVLDVGTDFTVIYTIKTSNVAHMRAFAVYDGTGYVYAGRFADGATDTVSFEAYDGSSSVGVQKVGSGVFDGEWHVLAFVKSGNTQNDMEIYIDGVASASVATSGTLGAYTLTKGFYYGAANNNGSVSTPILGSLGFCLVFNCVATTAEVTALSGGGSVPFKWLKNATDKPGDSRNSGSLVVGAAYRITARDGEDFTADGAASNDVGTEFVATASTVTLDANDTVLRLGCIAQYDPDGFGHGQMIDKSGNESHGAVSGAVPTNLPVNHTEKYVDLAVTGDTSFTLPAGYEITTITFKSSGAIGGGIDVGTTNGGGEIVSAEAIAGTTPVNATVIKGTAYNTTGAHDTIYITDADGTGWDSATVEVRVLMQRIDM